MTQPRLRTLAAKGDRRKTLEALRAVLADAIEDCDSKRDLAALSRQFVMVLDELNIPQPDSDNPLDELRGRRRHRHQPVIDETFDPKAI